MCAINGFSWHDENLIKTMNTINAHRGPDDTGIFCGEGISLGHNRLSILDTSSAGHQPMISHNRRYVMSYNGEVYNFKQLKDQLTQKNNIRWNSHSDSEVILEMFSHFGKKAFTQFEGIFAIAIWDTLDKKLFLARDAMGVKPLYYAHNEEKFAFSSTTRAISKHFDTHHLDQASLNNYFRFLYCVGPNTMLKRIKKLPQGQYAVFHNKTLTIKPFYQYTPQTLNHSRDEMHHNIRGLVRHAVSSQLVSDRPVGIFLSGGIDSTLVAQVTAQETEKPIHSFSIGFETKINPEKFNADMSLARKTAQQCNFEHHEIMITNNDVAENFEKCVIAMDEPVSNHIQVATYLMAQKAKEHVAVVLGGDGGDELFGGYDRYWYYDKLHKIQNLFPTIKNKKTAQFIAKLLAKPQLEQKLQAQAAIGHFFALMPQKEKHVASFLHPDINNGLGTINAYIPYFENQWEDYVNFMMWVDNRTWLADESLIRSDKLTMAHGLEQRVPLLDVKLMEYAMSIPSKYKLHSRTQGKHILKEAFKTLLPEEIFSQKKRGFFSPTAKWLREDPLKSLARELCSESYTDKTKDLFQWQEVQNILEKHIAHETYNLNTIWALMTFQVWARHNL